ncbi:MAG: hypothetical protein E7477_05265 [Ruminococcaceae bacterium]|nr:hypothetical protein [Oscillospiraceae bacterium]
MKKIISLILCIVFILLSVSCTSEEQNIVSGNDLSDAETSSTPTPEIETYPVKISQEAVYDTIDMWQIDGVFAQSIFTAEEIFDIRVFYVTEDNRLTMLSDFYPGDYPYCGACIINEDNSISHDYKQLVPYENFTNETDADGETMIKSGSYYQNLPKGSWYFGDANMSNSFIVVVGDYEASQNGTVPTN